MFSISAAAEKERRGPAEFELKELAKDHEVGFDALEAVLAYLYSGKVRPLPKAVCTCVDDDCPHVACRPAVDFMVEVLYASFTFQISELVALYQVNSNTLLSFSCLWTFCLCNSCLLFVVRSIKPQSSQSLMLVFGLS